MTRIKLDDDTSLVIKKMSGGKYKITLDADFSLRHLTGDLSVIVRRIDLLMIRNHINKLLDEEK